MRRIGLEGAGHAESLLWPLFVVLTPPRLDHNLGMGQAREPMLVKTFIAKAAIEDSI